FLWAPAVDALRGPRWGYRAWITVAQVAMGVALLPLGLAPLEALLGWAAFLLLAHAFAASTQDVAIDALAVATVPEGERGRITAWMQAGMLVGRGVFGGVALAAEQWIGAEAVVLALIACVWLTIIVVWTFPAPVLPERAKQPTASRFVHALVRVFTRRATWFGVGIALVAGAGFEAVGGLLGPFLLDRGVEQSTIGWFLALPVIACIIVGGLIGGWLADRRGHARMVRAAVIGVACWVSVLVLLDGSLRGEALMVMLLPLYAGVGVLTASSYALFMDLTDPAIGGTQFSAFMGATNLCEVWAVALAGNLAARGGYGGAFLACAGISLLALAMLPRRRGTVRA
ncbi:MAG: MFS transporter, partial [Phycisphaerales bacterium]